MVNSNIIVTALYYESYDKFATELCRRFALGTALICANTVLALQRGLRGGLSLTLHH